MTDSFKLNQIYSFVMFSWIEYTQSNELRDQFDGGKISFTQIVASNLFQITWVVAISWDETFLILFIPFTVPYYLIMEYVECGKLLNYLRRYRKENSYYNDDYCRVAIGDLILFSYQAAKGMEFISNYGVSIRWWKSFIAHTFYLVSGQAILCSYIWLAGSEIEQETRWVL